jgi:hypothetical protein
MGPLQTEALYVLFFVRQGFVPHEGSFQPEAEKLVVFYFAGSDIE